MSLTLQWPRVERSVLARVLPFALYMAFLVLRSELKGHVDAAFVQWLYPIQIMTVVAALWHFRHEYSELWGRTLPPKFAERVLLSAVLGTAVFVAWIHLDVWPLSIGSAPAMSPPLLNGELDWRWLMLRVMGAALVVPVMEELFWRSFIMRWLEARDFIRQAAASVSWRSMFISSIVFGLEHNLWFAGALAGMAYAYLYRLFGLWSAVVAHGLTNLLLGLWVIHTEQWQFW